MKLDDRQLAHVREQINADPLEDTHPAMGTLIKGFGDHTFYVDPNGIYIFLPSDQNDHQLVLVQIAGVDENDPEQMAPIEPQLTSIVVDVPPLNS